jgi:hypothetical protein
MGAESDQAVLYIFGAVLVLAGGAVCYLASRAMTKKEPAQFNPLLKLIAGIGLVVAGIVLLLGFESRHGQPTLEEKLQTQMAEINQTLPRMLDENTQFDIVRVTGREINYDHTVVSRASYELDSIVFQNIMIEKLTKELCPQDDIRALLRESVRYRYNYYASDGVLVSSVLISRETCGIR